MAGLTTSGFEIKRLTEIAEEIKENLRSEFGATITTSSNSVFGRLAGIMAKPIAELWELAQAVYSSQYPNTASGIALDNIMAFTGIVRRAASESTAWVAFNGTRNTVIQIGSIVEHESTLKRFATTEEITLDETAVVGATITCATGADTEDFIVIVDSETFTYTCSGSKTAAQVASGLVALIDPSYALTAINTSAKTLTISGDYTIHFTVGKRCRITGAEGGASVNNGEYTVSVVELVGSDTVVTVTESISSATVSGNLRGNVEATADSGTITLTALDLPDSAGDASAFAFAYSVSNVNSGLTIATNQVVTNVECTETGPNEALRGEINVIGTPTSGLTDVENVIAADVGRDEETDAALRTRRLLQLKAVSLATKLAELSNVDDVRVYENNDGETDDDGRPGHTVECVVTGGDDDEIAQTIFDVKPAGIGTYGNTLKLVEDEQGADHAIYYSRPTDVDIWVTVVVDGTYSEESLPSLASAAIKTAVVNYGKTFKAGLDVIPQRISGAIFAAVEGLEELTIKVGTSSSPSSTSRLAIGANQVARFSVYRTVVEGL